MTIKETKDQIQHDLITLLEDKMTPHTLDTICQIVVDNFKKLEKNCYTESDMRKAHTFGTMYMKGTIGEAQEYRIEKLLKS